MTPEQRIEAVARKLARLQDFFGDDVYWQGSTEDAKDIIHLVLQSLREPSEGMIDVGYDLPPGKGNPPPDEAWRAMIDAAIKEME